MSQAGKLYINETGYSRVRTKAHRKKSKDFLSKWKPYTNPKGGAFREERSMQNMGRTTALNTSLEFREKQQEGPVLVE